MRLQMELSMTAKPKLKTTSLAPIKPPCLIVVANLRGGSGKTTTCITLADLYALNGIEIAAFQVDEQPQLAKLLGRRVVSLLPSLGEASHARALSSPFSPLYAACQAAAENGGVVLVDVGANMVSLLGRWLRDVSLQEDLDTWSMTGVVLVPAVRESAALEGAVETLSVLRRALPSALPVFIENQRDETFATLKPNSELGRFVQQHLAPALDGCARLSMPAIEGEAWATFEATGLRFLKALALSPSEVSALIQEDIAEAKIMRSYIVRYLRAMHAQFGTVFDLPEGGA